MDNVLVDFKTGKAKLADDELIKFEGRNDEVPNIYSKLEPVPDALDSYEKLCHNFDTCILSTLP